MSSYILTASTRQTAQRIAFVCIAASLMAVAISATRLILVRHKASELRLGVTGRMNRLRESRRTATPKGVQPTSLSRSQAVSKLRSTLTKVASEKGVAIDEFQASTDEMPYVTVYSTESNDPGWMQVAVKFSMSGSGPRLVSTLAALRSFEVPFEVDNIEFTRRSTDTSGRSVVAEQVQLRVLVYRGEA